MGASLTYSLNFFNNLDNFIIITIYYIFPHQYNNKNNNNNKANP